MDVTYAYHCGTLRMFQVGTFSYAFASVPGYYGVIICIDIFLPMVWMDSPKFFYAFSKILTDVATVLADTALRVLEYGSIAKISAIGRLPPFPHAWEILAHIDYYMFKFISTSYMVLIHSLLPQNNGNLPLPFLVVITILFS